MVTRVRVALVLLLRSLVGLWFHRLHGLLAEPFGDGAAVFKIFILREQVILPVFAI